MTDEPVSSFLKRRPSRGGGPKAITPVDGLGGAETQLASVLYDLSRPNSRFKRPPAVSEEGGELLMDSGLEPHPGVATNVGGEA